MVRGKDSHGAIKYSFIEVAFEAGCWRISRISIDRHRGKGILEEEARRAKAERSDLHIQGR